MPSHPYPLADTLQCKVLLSLCAAINKRAHRSEPCDNSTSLRSTFKRLRESSKAPRTNRRSP